MDTKGWIVYNGSLQAASFLDYANMLQCAMEKKHSRAKIIPNNELPVMLHTEQSGLLHKKMELPDYILFTDKDVYLARQLECMGVRVFNKAEAIAIADDKISTYQKLAQCGLPIPKTIISPKVFMKQDPKDLSYIDNVIRELGFPMIVKESFGSFGEQVYLIENKIQLLDIADQLHGKSFMFQEFVASSFGTDVRLQVVGDRVVTAMKRIAKDDFRANVTAGASMVPYQPNSIETELAVAAAKSIHGDFVGVDLLFGENGPIICEINANAHIRNLLDCTGVNAADDIADHVLHTLQMNAGTNK